MIRQTESFESIVDRSYADQNYNVFYSEGVLHNTVKDGDCITFLYSDKYLVPVTICKRGFFKYAYFIVEPVVIKDGDESLRVFLDEACLFLRKQLKIQWINPNSTASLFMDFPTNSKHIPFGSHIIDLSLSEDELWDNVHSKHRNVIKKSEKDGVEIISGVTDKLIEDYHAIDKETWKRSNQSAVGLEALKKQVYALGDNAIIYIAYLDGEPQSGAFFWYNMQMCYYMYGANCDKPHTGAGNLLQWQAIRDMKAKGVKKYSFVGCRINEDENSKYHGIQRFKERFGGELVQGYLFKIDYNKFMALFFKLSVAIKSLLSSGRFIWPRDIVDQEISKWR